MNKISHHFNNRKVSIFSDIHFGKNKDSELKLGLASSFIDSYIECLKQENISTVFFLGDYFDNRDWLSVKTDFIGYQNILKFEQNKIHLFLIVGNHDLYYKSSNDINSVKKFESLKYVHVIDEPTLIDSGYSELLLIPWVQNVEQIKFDTKYDACFGHFEFKGAQLCGSISTTGFEPSNLLDISDLVFTGHFHIQKEYDFKNGKIVSVGSPLQLDWGDYGNNKGFFVFDVESKKYEFIENVVSPQYTKIYLSKVMAKLKTDFDKIAGNFVKLIVDCKYEYDQVIKITGFLNSRKPIQPVEVEYTFKNEFSNKLPEITDNKNYKEKTHFDYIKDVVDAEKQEVIDLFDKEKLLNYLNNYYKAQV